MSSLPPGLLLIVGSALACLLPRGWRSIAWLVLPMASLVHMVVWVPDGTVTHAVLFDLSLTPIRADRLSGVWGLIFHLAALLSALYGLHQRGRLEQAMGLMYAGAAIGSVYAGDLLTLFLFWELTAVTSVFLVWAGRTPRSYGAGMRYLIVQVLSGVLLLAGAIFQLSEQASLSFGQIGEVGVFRGQWGDTASGLLLLAFAIKAAFPLLHAWLPDAYPEASPAGTVFLSAFTTKLAIYTLIRGFAGFEPLIAIGCVMAIVPLIYAVLEDDIRLRLGLLPQQSARFYGRCRRCGQRTGDQWRGGTRRGAHSVQRPFVYGHRSGAVPHRYVEGFAARWTGHPHAFDVRLLPSRCRGHLSAPVLWICHQDPVVDGHRRRTIKGLGSLCSLRRRACSSCVACGSRPMCSSESNGHRRKLPCPGIWVRRWSPPRSCVCSSVCFPTSFTGDCLTPLITTLTNCRRLPRRCS